MEIVPFEIHSLPSLFLQRGAVVTKSGVVAILLCNQFSSEYAGARGKNGKNLYEFDFGSFMSFLKVHIF